MQPISLGLPLLKELGAKWLVEMADYIMDNPQFIINGFLHAGISKVLDKKELLETEKYEYESGESEQESGESQDESE